MNQNTLEFQEAKLARLEEARKGNKASWELAVLANAITKCKRRIERMKAPPPKEEKEKEQRKLTQEEKQQKKKDYERRRKNRYKGKEKRDGR